MPTDKFQGAYDAYKVKLIQMSKNPNYKNVELAGDEMKVDEGETHFIFKQYKQKMGDKEAHVIEMDGAFKHKDDIKLVEPWLKNVGTEADGELAKQLNSVEGLGSLNGTGLMQSIVALKLRELYEATTKK